MRFSHLLSTVMLLGTAFTGAAQALVCPVGWGSAAVESATVEALHRLYNAERILGASDCLFIVGWELATRSGWQRKERDKRGVLSELEAVCDAGAATSHRQKIGCALVMGERLKVPSLWNDRHRRKKWRDFAAVADTFETGNEAIWIRAQLERTAPNFERDSWREALVGLEWMQRTNPSTGSWWKADALYRQGNTPAALEAEEQARKESPILSAIPVSRWRKPADGVCSGWQPVIRLGPWNGLTGGASYCEENRYGKEQGVTLRASASTRGNFIGRGSIHDVSLLDPWRIRFSAIASRVIEDFYGVGLDSGSVATSWPSQKLEFSAVVDIPLRADAFGAFVSVGTRFMALEAQIPTSVTLPAAVAGVAGGIFTFGIDRLDSEFFAKRGWKVVAVSFLGLHPATYLREQISMMGVLPWTAKFRTKFQADSILNFGDAPFHEWAFLMGNIWMPGVRPYRYVNKNLWGVSVAQEWDFWRSLTLIPSLTLASANQGLSLADPWKGGASMGAVWFFSTERRWNLRVDAGIFAGKLTGQAGAELPF